MSAPPANDFFISYTQADRAWAEWVAWELEAAGYTCVIQAWDFAVGANFLARMDEALKDSGRTLLILTPDALNSRYVREEWTSALSRERLVPVRVRVCDPEGLLSVRAYLDLVGLEESVARTRLLAALEAGRAKPASAPAFPGESEPSAAAGRERPAYPGARPSYWHVPHARNPNFTGREALLEALARQLASSEATALTQAIAGLGGVGKTQLALEYSYRHGPAYAGVWWFRAESSVTLVADYGRLAHALELPEAEAADQGAMLEAVARRLVLEPEPWLLVFDNATEADTVRAYLPRGGRHHVLITSRSQRWRAVATPLTVVTWPREESVAFLLARTGSDDAEAAGALAAALGDLPLALEQAGAYCEANARSLADYLELYQARHLTLLERAGPETDYPDTVATTWALSFEAVAAAAPAAAELLQLVAFLAAEAIPKRLILDGAAHLPAALAGAVSDELILDDAIGQLRRHSLLEVADETWSVHRLVQAVTRARLGGTAGAWAERAVALVNEAFGYDEDDLSTWAPNEAMLPHAVEAAGHAEAHRVGLGSAGRLLNESGLFLLHRARLAEARAVLERALAIYEQVHGPEHPTAAIAANNIGQVLEAQGDLAGALERTSRALAIDEQVYGPEHPNVAIDANNIGQILEAQGDLAGALEYARRALAIDEQVHGPDHAVVARDANNIGTILQAQGDLAGALEHARRALAIDEQVYGLEHPTVASDANNIGQILEDQGDLAGALEHTRRALAIDEQVYGPDHPEVAKNAHNVGQILKAQGDLAGALEHTNRALAIAEQVYGTHHPTVATAASSIGLILRAQGDLAGALEHARRALSIYEQIYGSEHPSVATVANNIGLILLDQGDLAGALEHASRALAIDEQIYGPEHPAVATAANSIGQILQAQGDLAGALEHTSRALAIDEQIYGPEHSNVATLANNIGQILIDQGDLVGARQHLERALRIFVGVLGGEHPSTRAVAANLEAVIARQGEAQ